ncbi:apolipoprotein B-100 isoform X2 [Phyllopteryx taeniolatus]|uniref:apolipoprotein B-100 isoform X2 n=1 Tax=Phyllopteryx taeniolatus TaxID=161469 RepID=UPI002AD325DA|nr:apolipoprotein B-100 isoform X2 [Phyllopteryx taeniolatus]
MGYNKLYLLMLLSSCTLAQQDNGSNENPSTCLSTSRFKVNKKYIYQYITESSNGVVGTANLKNGPKVTCQVEIEVPQTCGFIMRTMECTLSEVVAMDHQGQPVYKQSNGSWAFQAAMARNPLKFSVQQTTSVQLYPESTEPVNILNVKRGIISALIVPAMDEEEASLLSTLHGQCLTEILVNKKKDIAVDVTLSRDLSQCDQFYSRKLANSPLALVQNLHRPLTKLITSKQECNYHFDNKGKHIITAMCKEKHIYLPFSNRDDGILSVVTQELRFQSCKRMNKRVFDVDPSHKKPLYFEEPEDKSPFQTKDAALSTLSDLQSLTGSDHGQKRTSLFHKLVSTLRNLRNETLSQTVSEMLRLSTWFTWQALLQCGTPECTSAILQAIRTLDGLALEVDALVYVLSLQANPDAARVGDMLSMTQYKQSKIIMYALGNTVKKFHQGKKTPEVTAVSEFMRTLLNDCSGEMNDDFNNLPPDPEAMSFLVLRVVGVMGQAMQTVSPDLISSIMKCVKRSDISLSNKKAAIQAFRQMDINDEIKHFLKEVYQDPLGDVEIRIAAYLILMKNPDQAIVTDIVNNIEAMKDDQLKNFVFSHLKNIQKSNEPQMHWYREYIELALQDRLLTTNEVIDGKSRNYKIESPVGAVWGNIIFDATDTLPKEVMLETTLKVFNYNYDIFEFSVEGRGLEPTVEALFGENGFFPDSISRVMYWAGDQAQMIKEVLHRMAPKTDRIKKQASQALLNDIAKTIRKLMKDVRSSPTPEATVYLKLLGNEMYVKTSEIRKMAENLFMYFSVFFQVLPPQIFFEFTSRTDNEFFIHYIFMENSFSLSTALGFPLKFSLAGVFAPGAKGGMTVYSNTGHLAFMPSIGLEFITQMGVHAPDYVEAGIEMHTNMYHEHSLNTKVTINKRQIRLSIPAPKSNTQLFTFSNKLVSVSSGQAMTIPFLVVDRTNSTDCHPLFSGLKICTLVHYSNASSRDQAPYFPLTSETMAAVLIQPTEEVTEYTATIKRETLKEGKNDRYEIDSLRLTLKAEGDDSTEATASLKYNCNKNILTTEVVIPKYDVELGIRMAGVDSDANQNNMRGITLEVTSKNIPQLTLVGRTRIELMKNAMLQLQMVIPALKTNALFTATLKKHEDIMMIIETMIKLPETSYQQTASLKYGTAMMSGRPDDHLECLVNHSFNHSLIQTSLSVSETLDVTNKRHAKANYKIEASGPLGFHASFYYVAQSTSTIDSDEVTGDGTWDGTLKIGSFFTNTSYRNSYNLYPQERKGRGESILRFDSPFVQIHNTIHGVYANFELNVVSKTNVQKDIFNHVSELNYKDSQLTLKCTGVAKIGGKLLRNKVEFGVSYLMVIINAELMADDETNQAYYLITGTLNSRGLKVNSDGSLTFDEGRGFHKASIVVDRNGLTTGGTNRIQYIPVTFENIFSGSIDSNGASLSSMTKAMAKEGYVELNIEGKITAKESSFYGVFNGNVFNAHTRNNVNYVLNRRAFTFISTSMVKMGQMKTENSHTLALTLWTVALHSKTGYFLCEDTYYKQDTKIDMKPFVMTFDAKTEVKLFDLSLNKVSHIKLEPVKVYLSGSTDGAYREEDSIKHTYEINYQAMSGKIKSNTSGNLLGINLCQTCELEFAGLSSASFCQSEINSKPLHFDSIIRTQALPFSLSVDALFNSDGEIILYGMHSGQLYSQLQFKAEPLVLVCSHDSRVLTMHALSNWKMSTQLDHKFDGFLMPNDQALTWKIKSKLHSHSYDQNISGYNNPQKAGFEFSGVMLTDAFHGLNMNIGSIEEMQEFSIGGFLKYDKSSSNIIAIPFPFLAAFEELKNTCINALETLQRYINNLDINQMISDFRVKLDQLPSQVNDFIKEMDLENKVNQIKEKVDYFINGFDVTMDDLEVMMSNLKKDCENKVLEIATKIRNLILSVNDYLKSRQISEKLIHVLAVAENKLHVFNEKYNIKVLLLEALQAIENIVENVDLVKFTDSSIDWLQELDSNYGVREKIKKILADMKDKIESFDVKILFQQMNMFLLSTNMGIEKLLYEIPYTDIANVMESINDVLVNWIDEYEIPNKLNAIYSYIRDHILKYDLDDIFKEIIDQAAILIKKIKIEETVHSIVNAVNVLNFELIHDQMLQFIYSVKKYLRLIDLNKRIEELNKDISSAIQSLNDFDYNSFVNKANKKIAEVTNCINERIKKYEIVFKFEAVREFIRKIQSIIFHYIEKLKNTRVADSLKKLKDVIDSTFYIDIKMKVQDIIEDIRQRIFEMDIREEMYFYLQRASESYSNISAKVNRLIVEISKLVNDSEILCQIKQTIDDGLNELNNTEIQVYSFTVLFTDLVIPRFTINMNKLHEITIPAEISVPEFNIIGSVTVPAFTISFDELKAKILAMIDYIKGFEMPAIDLDGIFGDLKVLYIFSLPDVTFPEITLSEIKVPTINMPKLHIKDFDVMPGIKRPDIAHENCVQVFGKFQGEFKVNFPVYTLGTTGMIEHSTSSPQSPKFKATIHSHAKSTIQIMEYTFDAMAQLEAPGLKELKFTEIIKVSHSAFSIEHDASLVIMGSLAEVSAQTVSKATTSMYTADLVNSMTLSLRIGISVTTTTSYNHNFNITSMEISSQTSVKHYMASTVDRGITWSSKTTAYGKWSWENYSDEGTHESTLEFNTNFNTTKLTFLGDIDCTALKVKPILKLESLTFSHIVVDARCELEASFMKSVIGANGEANIWDLKVALTAYHDSQLSGCVTGSIYNTMEFMSHSFETVYDVKNKVTINMVFPLKLTGKVDLQYDYGTKLNSEKQQIYWTGLARFNQYKYNYSIGAEHNYNNVTFNLQAYGEANVDFLTVPFSVPLMNVPFLGITTPEVKNLSLWEHAGLKTLLTTPQQSFDAHLKFTYKNTAAHSFDLHLEPIYGAISDSADRIRAKFEFEHNTNKLVELLKG